MFTPINDHSPLLADCTPHVRTLRVGDAVQYQGSIPSLHGLYRVLAVDGERLALGRLGKQLLSRVRRESVTYADVCPMCDAEPTWMRAVLFGVSVQFQRACIDCAATCKGEAERAEAAWQALQAGRDINTIHTDYLTEVTACNRVITTSLDSATIMLDLADSYARRGDGADAIRCRTQGEAFLAVATKTRIDLDAMIAADPAEAVLDSSCAHTDCPQARMSDQTNSRSVLVHGWYTTMPEDLARKFCGTHAQTTLSNLPCGCLPGGSTASNGCWVCDF